jgi:DNA-binding winged helix-turn-helix (wHTH) protein/tetratricopeptide (TPR) repeat protein/TolB-like protein
MDSAPSLRQVYRFGLFAADAAHGTLAREGTRVKIQEQPFRVLLMLLERPGEIVTREDLRQKLWPNGTFVDFDGSLNVILKRLRAAMDDDPEHPRYIETIPRQGYRFIAPVSIGEANGATAEASSRLAPSAVPRDARATDAAREKRSRRPMLVAYAATLLVIVALLVTYQISWYRKAAERNALSLPAQASVPLRKSVAVLGFQNVTGKPEDAWMGTAFSEMLSTELAGGGTLRLVAGEDVANLRHASPWPQTDTLDRTTTERIGTALDSDVLVLGSYTAIGNPQRGQLRLDVRLQDAKTGEILTETSETGSARDLFQMVSAIGGTLRDKLGVPRLEAEQQANALATLPSDSEAARLYSLGLEKFREYDYAAAQGLFEQAAKAEPAFPLSHTMLARAYIALGYDDKAKAEAKQAVDLANQSKLSRVQKMEIDAAYYQSLGQRDKAAGIYKVLFNLYPDSLEYGLQLAKLQLESYQPDASLETIKELRRLPPPASEDPAIDYSEARVLSSRDPAAAQRLAQSSADKAQKQGKRFAYANAEQALCFWNHRHIPSPPECREAYNIFIASGNRDAAASTLEIMAETNRLTGHDQSAISLYQRALEILKETGDREEIGVTLNNLSLVLEGDGQWSQAETYYREARENFQAVNDWANNAVTTDNIANILSMRGRLKEAAALYQKSWELMESSGRGRPDVMHLGYDSLLLSHGEMQKARSEFETQTKSLRAYGGDPYQLANAISGLGDVEKAAGNLEGARQDYQETLGILKKVNFPVSGIQPSLADLSVAEGHPKAAEALLQPALAEFEKEQSRGDEIGGYTILSRALLAQGRVSEARDAIHQAMRFADLHEFPVLGLPLDVLDARAMAMGAKSGAAGRADLFAAAQKLRAAIEKSHRLGLYMIECEARLALGEVEMKLDPAAGRAQLNELAAETHARGYDLYSRQAQQAISSASSPVAANQPEH